MKEKYSVEDLRRGAELQEKLLTLGVCLSVHSTDTEKFRKSMEGVREIVMAIDCIMYRMYRMGDHELYHQMQTEKTIEDIYLTWLGVGAVAVSACTLSMLAMDEQMLRPVAADLRQRAARSHEFYMRMFLKAH